ncbi:MAG: SRPBCC domain-containing protein [Anaerolineales bacterium]|nr:SRPBCC domain-containing protein [Anaerolineales bacterium]
MAKTQSLKFKRALNVSPAAIYRALTNATALREWFCDLAIAEPHKGGRLYFGWNQGYYATGEFTKLDPDRKVAFTWLGRGEPAATHVRIGIAEKKSGTVMTVEHEDVGAGKKWAGVAAAIARGWETGLENLQSVLETGHDLRFTLRPMLGVSGLNSLTRETAERLQVPARQGVVIDGTVEGMGAEVAGLHKDDVLVAIGKHKVYDFPSLATVLQRHRAGDKVNITYYRAGVEQTVELELSRRPLPEMPATAAELVQRMRQIYASDDAALSQAIAGISDAEAGFKPSPEEWGAKEVMAHLITGERDTHAYIEELVGGELRPFDNFVGNSQFRMRATAQAYPNLAAMLEALRQAQAETLNMLAALPDDFVAGRRSWWPMVYGFLQNATHTPAHVRQIEAAVNAARQQAAEAAPAEG